MASRWNCFVPSQIPVLLGAVRFVAPVELGGWGMNPIVGVSIWHQIRYLNVQGNVGFLTTDTQLLDATRSGSRTLVEHHQNLQHHH